MNEWIVDGWIDGWMDGWVVGGWVDEWTDEWTDGRIHGRMDGSMNGWTLSGFVFACDLAGVRFIGVSTIARCPQGES